MTAEYRLRASMDLQQSVRDLSPEAQGPKFCSKCGNGLRQGAKFCGTCQKPVVNRLAPPQSPHLSPEAQGPKFCSKCGNGLRQGAKFCGTCQTPVVNRLASPQSPHQPLPVLRAEFIPPEKREKGEVVRRFEAYAAASLASPEHPNQDRHEVIHFSDGRIFFLVLDGSGGSLKESGLTEEQQMQLISKKMDDLAQFARGIPGEDQAINSDGFLNKLNKWLINHGQGVYCAAMLAEWNPNNPQRLGIHWVGDVAALAWSGNKYPHRRNPELWENEAGGPSMVQLLTRQHNLVTALKEFRVVDTPTRHLDLDDNANILTHCMGEKTFSIQTTTINLADHRFVVIGSDGIQPNALSTIESDDDNEKRGVFKHLQKLRRTLREAWVLTWHSVEQIHAMQQEMRGSADGYLATVAYLFRQASNRKITLPELAKEIVSRSRKDGDQDDITAMVLDARALEKHEPFDSGGSWYRKLIKRIFK